MTTYKMNQLMPEYERIKEAQIMGKRTFNEVTFNPSKANPGEEIYINLPGLGANMCLVPNSLFLTAKFKSGNAKSWFLNNLGRLLVSSQEITVGGKVVYDNINESVYSVYSDLWLSSKQRANMVSTGIMNENTRKLMSKDDSGDKSEATDASITKIFANRVRIKLGKILNDHGLYAPYGMNSDIRYKIRLPSANDIMVAQGGQAVAGYTLEDIRLEYVTLEDPNMYNLALDSYQVGRSHVFEHITMMKKDLWGKDTTLINENINLPRQCMKSIVMLFKNKTYTDSEEYVYPNITNVKVTIEGIPNSVYSQGMNMSRLFTEAKKVFLNKKRDTLPVTDFYPNNKFALAIDLRAFNDNNVSGNGRKILNTQSGILLEITKEVTTADLICYIFVVSDGFVNIVNKSLQSVEY